jgi:hypothetical protein
METNMQAEQPAGSTASAGVGDVDGLAAVAARLVCFGLVGLWWSRPGARRRRALCRQRCPLCRTTQRRSRAALFIVAGVLAVLAVVPVVTGQLWRTDKCLDAPSLQSTTRGPLRYLVTAPASGAALAYINLLGADVCTSPDDMLVANMHGGPIPRAGVAVGDVYITRLHEVPDVYSVATLSHHEAAHSWQWAVASLIAGPTAFPTAYGAVELILPGAQNPFERAAGLTSGGYDVPDAVELLWIGIVTWAGVGAVVFTLRQRRRGKHNSSCPLRRGSKD